LPIVMYRLIEALRK